MDPNVKLRCEPLPHCSDELLDDPLIFRRLVGKMMYLTITRPNIIFAVNKLCQFASAPQKSHYQASLRVLHYLKGTVGMGIFYSSDCDMVLKAFTDADWVLAWIPDDQPPAIVCSLAAL